MYEYRETCGGTVELGLPGCLSGEQKPVMLDGELFCDICIKGLRERAKKDSLTGLSNRYDLERRFNHLIETDNLLGVLHLDIAALGALNNRSGHPVGDILIKRAAESLRSNDVIVHTAARMGGDEFAVLVVKKAVDSTDNIKAEDRREPRNFSEEEGLEILGSVSERITNKFNNDILVAEINASAPDGQKHRLRLGAALYMPGHSLDDLLLEADSKYSARRDDPRTRK